MMRQRGLFVLLLLAFIAVPFIAGALGNTYMITMATRVLICAMVAVSLDLLVGWGGLVSFGHAAFFGLGGYVVAIAATHATQGGDIFGWGGTNEALIAWPLAMLVSAGAALVIGALSLRTSGVYFIMITLAFAQMLYFVFVALKVYGGDDGLSMTSRNLLAGARITDARSFYWICLILLAVVVALVGRLLNARFGLVLRGAKASERRMAALGFPVYRYRLVAFVIAGAIAGLAGALWANLGRFAAPDMLSWLRSGEFLVMVILGGSASLLGPVLGAAVFLILETQLAAHTEHWQVIFGPLVVLAALYMPMGLWGYVRGRSS